MSEELSTIVDAGIQIPPQSTIFCDMDGTLIDTDFANFLAYRRAVIEATNGKNIVKLTEERLNRKRLKNLLSSLTPEEEENITTLKTEYFPEFLSETRLNSQLAEILIKNRNQSKIFLVSNCRESRVVQVLKHHKLLDSFIRLICRELLPDDDSSNKYEAAIRLTKADPDVVMVFENDKAEAQQATHAGIPRRNIYCCPLVAKTL
jgi:phosphoglycolate phosphatase-like HAD superfamily hydrolase